MRKMKKINGFLVVRFNDREKRDYPELGRFGVIDAEDYTGDLDFDRDAMEYTDADTLEVAVEQARGLSAEEDFSQEPPTCTVIVDRAEETSVEEVEPQLLVLGQKQRLMGQIASKHHPDITPRTAAHELKGYKAALYDLGLLDADGAMEEPDAFWHAPPSDRETFLAYVCDELCGWRTPEMTQEQLDAICENAILPRKARPESLFSGDPRKAGHGLPEHQGEHRAEPGGAAHLRPGAGAGPGLPGQRLPGLPEHLQDGPRAGRRDRGGRHLSGLSLAERAAEAPPRAI